MSSRTTKVLRASPPCSSPSPQSPSPTAGGAGASEQSPFALPRAETLYTSGKQWGPYTNFNPLRPDYNTGVVGLLYETLFRYDPLKDRFIPWLATSAEVGRARTTS